MRCTGNIFTWWLMALLVIAGCREERDILVDQDDTPDPPGTIITTGLVGVLDQPGWLGPQTLQLFDGQTDAFQQWGFRYGRGTLIDRDYELVQLQAGDQPPLYQVANLRENDINYLHWTIPVFAEYNGRADANADFTLPDGERLSVQANQLRREDSTLYTGPYSVHIARLAPDGEYAAAIPSFSGHSVAEGPVSLLIRQCYYIDIRSADGHLLQANEGLSLTLPGASAISSWYFDPNRARWVDSDSDPAQTGIAIPRSGYFATADSRPLIRVHGTLRVNDALLPHYPINIRYADITRRIYTTANGQWQIALPADHSVEVEIPMPCNAPLGQTLMTTGDVEMLVPLEFQSEEVDAMPVSGTARDCATNPVNGSFLTLAGSLQSPVYIPESEIAFHTLVCRDAPVGVQAIDVVRGEQGPQIEWPNSDTLDMHQVLICTDAQSNYILITVSGEHKLYDQVQANVTGQMRLRIEEVDSVNQADFHLLISGMEAREFSDPEINIFFEDMGLGEKGYSLYCPTATGGCGFTRFVITHYPDAPGDWIRGYFEGRFWIKSFMPLTAGYRPVTGQFQVYRDF